MSTPCPVFAICGYSGAGKTTLVEALVHRLEGRGLRVAVIKHDAHGPQVDTPGKDSDRFFRAGADVVLHSPAEAFLRLHAREDGFDLQSLVAAVGPEHDLVLVEGHKTTPLQRKLWLLSDGETAPPVEAGAVECVLGRNEPRLDKAAAWLDAGLSAAWRSVPVKAGLLMGGRATRMGQPKHLMRVDGETWLERVVRGVVPCVQQVVLLGAGDVPASANVLVRLPDVPDRGGPLAGMLSAMRWDPACSWVFVACDMPLVTEAALAWVLSTRKPGVWATLPRLDADGPVEPLLAHYDWRTGRLLEACRGPAELARHPQTLSPVVPPGFAAAWRNANTPGDAARLF